MIHSSMRYAIQPTGTVSQEFTQTTAYGHWRVTNMYSR